MGFVHSEDFDTADFDIDDINESSDVRQLMAWLEETTDALEDMRSQVEASKFCGHYEDDWMERVRSRIGFCSMGKRRLERRLLDLGVNPHPKAAPDEIADAQRATQRAKEALTKARSAAEFGRHLLDVVRAHVSPAVFDVIVSQAASKALENTRAAEA